jgi:hypothetical protein
LALGKIPNKRIVFVCGNSDISFASPDFTRQIIAIVKRHNRKHPGTTYYLQSKRPEYFAQFLKELPESLSLVTTLETNRDDGYERISKAPPPSERYRQFLNLDYPRKVVTIEPIMQFDLDVFTGWICQIQPEYVWLGFNSKPDKVELPEPSETKVQTFMRRLADGGIEMRGKDLRGLELPR